LNVCTYKRLETYLPVNLLGPGPRLIKKEFTGPRSHKGWETLVYGKYTWLALLRIFWRTPAVPSVGKAQSPKCGICRRHHVL